MKKKGIVIKIAVILIIIIAFMVGLYIVPYIRPIKVKNPLNGVCYQVYGDYAEVISSNLGGRKQVKVDEKIIGRTVTRLQNGCLQGSYAWEVTIPGTVEEIGASAFNASHRLKTFNMEGNIKSIGEWAFANCHELETIELNEGLEYIGSCAFLECGNLKTVTIPASVKEIDTEVFKGSGLEEIIFEGKVENIGYAAFEETPWLEKQGNYVICNDILLQYRGESSVSVIPEGVRTISGAYREREDVTDIYMPMSLEKVKEDSFLGKRSEAAVRIYIPAEIQNIEFENDEAVFAVENTTIVTTKGSYAESLAAEYGIDCEIVDEIVYPE